MTPSSENFPNQDSHPASSALESLDNLVDLLLNSDEANAQDDNLDIAESEKTIINNSPESQALNVEDLKLPYDDITDLTLDQAVEYEEFLQQTIDEKSETIVSIDQSDKSIAESDSRSSLDIVPSSSKSNLPTPLEESGVDDISLAQSLPIESDIVDSVNTLIPLVVELLKYRIEDSQDSIVNGVAPVLDRIIEQRTLEDSPKMAAAIAKILPNAITQGINLSPQEIAKSIAPELALCITEQIRLDENAISEALGSEIGKAVRTQIELDRDAMVDALYPVIGTTISKYMVEVVQEINRKVDSTLSPEGIKRKIQAKVQGVSEAELIFRESVGYFVQAAFLIDKDSGIVIHEIKRDEDQHLDSGMIAGMLTAIRSFANDCIVSGSELDEIDYGDFQIPIEVAGYCYLAVVVKGEPSKDFRARIRRVLGEIVQKHGDEIANFEGDKAVISPQVRERLDNLLDNEEKKPKSTKPSSPILLWLLVFILSAIFIPWGIINYRASVAQNIEQITLNRLDTAPELSIYRLDPYVHRGRLTITGKVPNRYLYNQAATITQEIASRNNLRLDNKIITIKIPPSPDLINSEIKRLTSIYNQQPDTSIQTEYQSATKTLIITGFDCYRFKSKPIAEVFDHVPGIAKIVLNLETKLPKVPQKIYFNSGSDRFDFTDSFSKIDSVNQFLQQYPQLSLKLIAHSDGQGLINFNRKLGQQRCHNIRAELVVKGIASKRLNAECKKSIVSHNDDQATWLERYVSFETFIPASNSRDSNL